MMSTKGPEDPDRKSVTLLIADDHYCKMYGLRLKTGRFYVSSDSSATSESLPEGQRFPKAVVNEKLVRALGYSSNEAAIGKRFWIGINGWSAEVVGVVADFNVNSLHEDIKPTLIVQHAPFYDKVNIKIGTGADIHTTIGTLSKSWKNVFPRSVFEFNFLDEQLDNLYKTESRLYGLFKIFSALAMLISCLGLWGLVAYAAEQRVKEIGIRKVLGASVTNIVELLIKDFIILVAIAILIASPLAYWGMHKWLEEFAFRIEIGWMVFVIAAVVALLVAMFTVSFRAIKAALTNPVLNLRTE